MAQNRSSVNIDRFRVDAGRDRKNTVLEISHTLASNAKWPRSNRSISKGITVNAMIVSPSARFAMKTFVVVWSFL